MVEDAVRRYYASYNSEDPERLGALLADDLTFTGPDGTSMDKDAYLSMYRYMIGTFIDRMEPTSIEVAGEVATVRLIDRLTARAEVPDFMGMSMKKGETVALEFVARYTVANGKISAIDVRMEGESH